MKIIFINILFFSLILNAQLNSPNFDKARNSINEGNFKRHLNYLGNDLFEGRGTGLDDMLDLINDSEHMVKSCIFWYNFCSKCF